MSGRLRSLFLSFEEWLHASAPAERLAGLRIAVGAFVVGYMVVNVGEFDRLANSDSSNFEPIGLARLVEAPLSATLTWLLFAALVLTGFAFTVGFFARFTGPSFAVLVLFWTSYHSSWGQLLHFEHLFTIHVMILALAPCAEAWALSSAAPTAPSPRFGWPVRLMAIATAVTYVLSGIAKLRYSGAAWFETDTLATHIGYSATRMETIGSPLPPLARPVLERRWLIAPMAGAALAVELAAPLALLGRRLRNSWIIAALLFHAASAATMHVFFGYRGLGFAMLPLFHLERFPKFVASRFQAAH